MTAQALILFGMGAFLTDGSFLFGESFFYCRLPHIDNYTIFILLFYSLLC